MFSSFINFSLLTQSFMINPTTGQEILISPDVMTASTPISKPNIILNPKMPMPSSGYVSQPLPKVISPASPMTSNGYVTHSMFNVSFLPFFSILKRLTFDFFYQPMQSSGYTPLSAFGKPLANQNPAIDDKNNLKTPIVATTDQEGISGEILIPSSPQQ